MAEEGEGNYQETGTSPLQDLTSSPGDDRVVLNKPWAP